MPDTSPVSTLAVMCVSKQVPQYWCPQINASRETSSSQQTGHGPITGSARGVVSSAGVEYDEEETEGWGCEVDDRVDRMGSLPPSLISVASSSKLEAEPSATGIS